MDVIADSFDEWACIAVGECLVCHTTPHRAQVMRRFAHQSTLVAIAWCVCRRFGGLNVQTSIF